MCDRQDICSSAHDEETIWPSWKVCDTGHPAQIITETYGIYKPGIIHMRAFGLRHEYTDITANSEQKLLDLSHVTANYVINDLHMNSVL